jgi:hypothetical protein
MQLIKPLPSASHHLAAFLILSVVRDKQRSPCSHHESTGGIDASNRDEKMGSEIQELERLLLGGSNAVLRRGLMFEAVFSLRIRQI